MPYPVRESQSWALSSRHKALLPRAIGPPIITLPFASHSSSGQRDARLDLNLSRMRLTVPHPSSIVILQVNSVVHKYASEQRMNDSPAQANGDSIAERALHLRHTANQIRYSAMTMTHH